MAGVRRNHPGFRAIEEGAMAPRRPSASWAAFVLFFFTVMVVTVVLDWANGLLAMRHLAKQIGLITLGIGIFAIVGWRAPQITAQQGVLLAFTVGALTIIPAVLMGLGDIPGFWSQYFLVALGMAVGSFLAFLFVRLSDHLSKHD
jgi:hypothetical protein